MLTTIKQQLLHDFIERLKNAGFKVYLSDGKVMPVTWCHFVKDDKIGYVESGDYGFNFGTVHKPCRECGTGFGMERETHNPTIRMAEDCLIVAPSWARSDIPYVKKYKDWQEYVSLNNWTTYREV